MLKDSFGRIHDYLRISFTDRCNFRCLYCLPEPEYKSHCGTPVKDHMSADEIISMSKVFVELGVKKIRITGGEPLVRKDAGNIISELGRLPVTLALTTNGSRLHEHLAGLKQSGIHSVNVSLDSLKRDVFHQLTNRDEYDVVKQNIETLISGGFHVKVNMVVMNGYNDEELCDFVSWTKDAPVHIRFIEFMPFPGNHWRPEKLITYKEILERIQRQFQRLEKLEDHPNDTTKKYKVTGHAGTFAVISTMSEPFCGGCNRLRLTADGKMRNCLFAKNETDLLTPFREGKNISDLIRSCLDAKSLMLGGNEHESWALDETAAHKRSMMGIGG